MSGFFQHLPSAGDTVWEVSWNKLKPYIESIKGSDDYTLFQYSVVHIRYSFLLTSSAKNQGSFYLESADEDDEIKCQTYYLSNYLKSCNSIQYDSCPDQIIKDGLLDLKQFPALSERDISDCLASHIKNLRELNFLHSFYAFRKAIAKCKSIKWDDDFDKILELDFGSEWFNVSANGLEKGFYQNHSLLRGMRNDIEANEVADGSIPECFGDKLLLEIDRQYSEELLKLVNEQKQRKIFCYHQHVNVLNLMRIRAAETQAAKINYITQDSQSNPQILEKLRNLKYQVGRVQTHLGGSIKRLSGIVLSGAAVFALATWGKKS